MNDKMTMQWLLNNYVYLSKFFTYVTKTRENYNGTTIFKIDIMKKSYNLVVSPAEKKYYFVVKSTAGDVLTLTSLQISVVLVQSNPV